MSWFRRGITRLHCPTIGCPGSPVSWVHPGDPLMTEEAWEDWDRMIRESEIDGTDQRTTKKKMVHR